MNPGLTWVSGWCSSSVDALVSAKGQSQLRRSFVRELEIVDEWFGDEKLEELFEKDIVMSIRREVRYLSVWVEAPRLLG